MEGVGGIVELLPEHLLSVGADGAGIGRVGVPEVGNGGLPEHRETAEGPLMTFNGVWREGIQIPARMNIEGAGTAGAAARVMSISMMAEPWNGDALVSLIVRRRRWPSIGGTWGAGVFTIGDGGDDKVGEGVDGRILLSTSSSWCKILLEARFFNIDDSGDKVGKSVYR